MSVEFAPIWSLIDTVEKETGVGGGGYTVTVTPRVHVAGALGAQDVDEQYAQPFTMRLSRAQIGLDDGLARSEEKKPTDTMTREQYLGAAGLRLPVSTARWAGLAGAALSLAIAGLLAGFIFLGWRRGEAARIQARYGAMLIGVAKADPEEGIRRVEVATIQDLAHLAQRNGQTIFHQQAPGSNLYFVDHGDVVYSYRSPKAGEKG